MQRILEIEILENRDLATAGLVPSVHHSIVFTEFRQPVSIRAQVDPVAPGQFNPGPIVPPVHVTPRVPDLAGMSFNLGAYSGDVHAGGTLMITSETSDGVFAGTFDWKASNGTLWQWGSVLVTGSVSLSHLEFHANVVYSELAWLHVDYSGTLAYNSWSGYNTSGSLHVQNISWWRDPNAGGLCEFCLDTTTVVLGALKRR